MLLVLKGNSYCCFFLNLCKVFRIVCAIVFCLLVSFNTGGTEPPLLELKANTKTFCIYCVVRREIFQKIAVVSPQRYGEGRVASGLQNGGFTAFWLFLDCVSYHEAYLVVVPLLSVLCYFLKHETVLSSFNKSHQKLLLNAY